MEQSSDHNHNHIDILVKIIQAPEMLYFPNQKPNVCYNADEKLQIIKKNVETTDINVNENCGELLREACKGTYIEIVKYLMSPKTDINKVADPKYCRDLVLPWACIGTLEDDDGNDLPRYSEKQLQTDVYGNTKEVEVLITHSKDEDILKLVQYLVEEQHLDVSVKHNFALRQSGIYNYVQTSRYLLEHGASYEQILEDAFCCACTNGYLELSKLIYNWSLEHHLKIECLDSERILRACTQGQINMAKWLYHDLHISFRDNNDDIFIRCCNCVNMFDIESAYPPDKNNPQFDDKILLKQNALKGALWLASVCDHYVVKFIEKPEKSGNFIVKEKKVIP